ncbi:HpcH/HpaI aldolase family protein [Verrucosispora sp. TAA-831]|uniref:HpcH/HpaI aldolase family protein n=1 Tax=Verrucosispora sp. TAA-831 TaxID=3422227 RepID=UPI003D6F6F6A
MSALGVWEWRRRLRDRLATGDRVVGTFVKLPTVDSVELARLAGFDVVVIDAEHSSLSDRDVLGLVRHAAGIGLPALVRVAALDAGEINRLLEAGAVGLHLPMLRTGAEMHGLRAATAYPPVGERSLSLAHPAAAYGLVGLDEYLRREAADPPVLVGQIETATTVDPLDEIVAGLDVVFAGTTDLAASLRAGGQDRTALPGRLAEIASAATRAGAAFGAWSATAEPDQLRRLGPAPVRYLVVGSDLQALGSSLRHLAEPLYADRPVTLDGAAPSRPDEPR